MRKFKNILPLKQKSNKCMKKLPMKRNHAKKHRIPPNFMIYPRHTKQAPYSIMDGQCALQISKRHIKKKLKYPPQNNNFSTHLYRQKFYLSIGSTLSRVLAWVLLEFFSSTPFHHILPQDATDLQYIDALLIYTHDASLSALVDIKQDETYNQFHI